MNLNEYEIWKLQRLVIIAILKKEDLLFLLKAVSLT